MTLSERLTVGLSHLSVFPKSQCPSGPLGNTAVAQSLLYSGEQGPEITSLLSPWASSEGWRGRSQDSRPPGMLSAWASSLSPTPSRGLHPPESQ